MKAAGRELRDDGSPVVGVVFIKAHQTAIEAAEAAGQWWTIRILHTAVAPARYFAVSPVTVPSGGVVEGGEFASVVWREGVVGQPPEKCSTLARSWEFVCRTINFCIDKANWHYDPLFYPAGDPQIEALAHPVVNANPFAALFERAVAVVWRNAHHVDADWLIEILSSSSWTRLDVGDTESVRQGIPGAKRVNFYSVESPRDYAVAVQWEDGTWTVQAITNPRASAKPTGTTYGVNHGHGNARI
jgi:hypothetical protein